MITRITNGGKQTSIIFDNVSSKITEYIDEAKENDSGTELEDEKRSLEAEISAANDRLGSVENEIFWRKNPECR